MIWRTKLRFLGQRCERENGPQATEDVSFVSAASASDLTLRIFREPM